MFVDDPDVLQPLSVVWEYMKLVHAPQPVDVILTLGSFDPLAAIRAAELWREGWAPIIVMSGGIAHKGTLLDSGWDRTEAEVFADVAMKQGVPREAILLEADAQNTGENFSNTRVMLDTMGIPVSRLIAVAKPYMIRRGYATGRMAWPNVDILMQCEDITARDYFLRDPQPDRTLRALVGDMHRIIAYPKLGFQIAQDVPASVIGALRSLVRAGFGDRLVPGYPL
jgi:uncharacterized SAM-binding protein YcdF (DUF218 family)